MRQGQRSRVTAHASLAARWKSNHKERSMRLVRFVSLGFAIAVLSLHPAPASVVLEFCGPGDCECINHNLILVCNGDYGCLQRAKLYYLSCTNTQNSSTRQAPITPGDGAVPARRLSFGLRDFTVIP